MNFGDRLIEKAVNLDEHNRSYIERMQKAAYRMKQFIDDLLRFSQVSTETIPFGKVDLNETVRAVLEDNQQKIQFAKAVVNINSLPIVEGHKTQLHQLFNNLLINSVKYKREGIAPIINISGTKKEEALWEITINDNGIGFEQKHAEKIFSLFINCMAEANMKVRAWDFLFAKRLLTHTMEL